MIRLVALIALQAFALLAGPAPLAAAVLLGAAALSTTRPGARRVMTGALIFSSMFAVIGVMGGIERALFKSGAPDLGRSALLSLRGLASFLAALAATRMFTLAEVLCSLKRLGAPDYLLTMAYLMIQDLHVLGRLAGEMGRSIRARGADARGWRRIRMLARASGNFVSLAADTFRDRHEHLQARGLALALPIEAWRDRELRNQG